MSCSRTQNSGSSESRTNDLSVPSLTLSHCAPQIPILNDTLKIDGN